MARTVSVTLNNEVVKTSTSPGYLLDIPGLTASTLALNSRSADIVYNGKTYTGTTDFNVSGISWDYTGAQKGRIEVNDNNTFAFSTIILGAQRLAGLKLNIYMYYQGAVSLSTLDSSDVVQIFSGTIDTCEISPSGKITVSVTSEESTTLNSPRRYIKPGPVATGFNWIPPAGTIIYWGSEKLKIESA